MTRIRTSCHFGCVFALALSSIYGCGDSRPLIVGEPTLSVHYDTRYEATLNSEKSRPLLEEAWRPYVEILDEPAAIVDWQNGVSTWEVFFATNRGVVSSGEDGQRATFGNAAELVASHGRAAITLPRRRRGVDPARAPDSNDPHHENVAQFRDLRRLTWEETARGISEQIRRSRQHDLLLFVHGFNVDFDSAVIRTAQISLDMPFNGAVVSYCWPSQGGIGNYENDERINSQSVVPFTDFLQRLLSVVPSDTRVNIVVHSMGNRIVMQALNQLPPATERKPFANVVLCAPDVGISDFQIWAKGVVDRCDQVTLYASTGDGALTISKNIHREPRAGNVWPPLVTPGVTTIDCTAVDLNFLGHSYYAGNVDVLADLFALIKQRQPPEERYYLTRKSSSQGVYFQYNKHAPRLLWTWNFDDEIQRR